MTLVFLCAFLSLFLWCGTHLAKGGGAWILHFHCLLPHLSFTVRAGDGRRTSDIIPGMGQVMLFRALHSRYGTCDVRCCYVLFSITWCVSYVCSLHYECMLHTSPPAMYSRRRALWRSAVLGTTRTMMMHLHEYACPCDCMR